VTQVTIEHKFKLSIVEVQAFLAGSFKISLSSSCTSKAASWSNLIIVHWCIFFLSTCTLIWACTTPRRGRNRRKWLQRIWKCLVWQWI